MDQEKRNIAKVIVAVFVIWILAQFFGGQLGMPFFLTFVIDFIAITAFLWVLFKLWSMRGR